MGRGSWSCPAIGCLVSAWTAGYVWALDFFVIWLARDYYNGRNGGGLPVLVGMTAMPGRRDINANANDYDG